MMMQLTHKLWVMFVMLLVYSGFAQAEKQYLPMDGRKIVVASALQVREGPSTDNTVLGRLKLGVTLHATQRTREKATVGKRKSYWYKVSDGTLEGWVFGAYLRDFDLAKREEIWLQLARERSTSSKLKFTDYADTFGFITAILPQVRHKIAGVELEFNRLLVLQRSVDQITEKQSDTQPYKRWLALHKGRVFFDEISGQWLTRAQDFWDLADKIPGTRLGDDIALYATNAPLGGECEGDISCNLGRLQLTIGEYLKRYPQGRHAGRMLREMDEVLVFVQQELKREPDYFNNDQDSGSALRALISQLEATQAPEHKLVLERLQAIQTRYKQAQEKAEKSS